MPADTYGPAGVESPELQEILSRAANGEPLVREDAISLSKLRKEELPFLLQSASGIRDKGKGKTLTFSRNVFVPLTQICRNRCGYCTFKYEPGEGPLFLTPEEVVEMAKKGAQLGCTELLFVTGDKPELLYRVPGSLGKLRIQEHSRIPYRNGRGGLEGAHISSH
jgi:2-iminoacetate synthase ThiH